MKKVSWEIFLTLLLILAVSVSAQDEDSEDEDEDDAETERTTSTTESVIEETVSINQTAISELIQAALDAQKKQSTTLPPLRTTKSPLKGNGTETDSVVLSALVQAALKNANSQNDKRRNGTFTMNQDQLDYTMSQTNRILEGITRGNVSSVVEEALKIRAPESVHGIITNMVSLVSGWNGGIAKLGTEQCNCQGSDPLYRRVKSEIEKYRRTRADESSESLEYIMSQVSKVMQSTMSGNISNVVENSLKIQASPNVQKIIVNMVTFLRNGVPDANLGPISNELCRCSDKKLQQRSPSDEKEIFRTMGSSPKPLTYINPYTKTVSVIKRN